MLGAARDVEHPELVRAATSVGANILAEVGAAGAQEREPGAIGAHRDRARLPGWVTAGELRIVHPAIVARLPA